MRNVTTVRTVDLVFDMECPYVDEARALLRRALAEVGLPTEWREWNREGAETPAELRGLGSPTILVNGVDVSGIDVSGNGDPNGGVERANCCRVYLNDGRLRGVPAFTAITTSLAGRRPTP